MAFKSGLVVGFAAGYVLGARAGRERYEEIRAWWNRFTGSPTVHHMAERGKVLAGETGRRGLHAVQRGVERAATSVRHRLHGEGDGFSPGDIPV
jgi:hypothetical protein